MKSKLFDPHTSVKPTALTREEHARVFVNPPTHAEIPVWSGNTSAGNHRVQKRPICAVPQEAKKY